MALKWVGSEKGAAGLSGIPARDLTDEEVAQYGGEAALLRTGLYARAEQKRDRQPDVREDKLLRGAPEDKAEQEVENGGR